MKVYSQYSLYFAKRAARSGEFSKLKEYVEGVYKMSDSRFIARVSRYGKNKRGSKFSSLSTHRTEELASEAITQYYENFINNK